jgi:uncharacterized protein YndB with AHSA1/START domain
MPFKIFWIGKNRTDGVSCGGLHMGTEVMRKRVVCVTVSRMFRASAARVFDAWLDPQRASQFLFTRPGQVIVRTEMDARVGGSYLFVARRDGRDIDHVGEYLEIDPPRRLVFTLRVPFVWTDDNRVTVEIVPVQDGCELTVTHEGVLEEHESGINSGWTHFLIGLETMLSPDGSESLQPPGRQQASKGLQ